jgi:SAM-dependent methyltransferase
MTQVHWDTIYTSTDPTRTGWYEESPEASLQLLDQCGLSADDLIVDAGAGVSTFIEALLSRGHRNLVGVDISAAALEALRERLGDRAASLDLRVADLRTDGLDDLAGVALWHDHAVLHFFTDEADRSRYAATIRRAVRSGGYAIIATFAPDAVPQCSGLDVVHYDAPALASVMGEGWALVDEFRYVYRRPDGDVRPFTYALFRREA